MNIGWSDFIVPKIATPSPIRKWLKVKLSKSHHYRHRTLKEDPTGRSDAEIFLRSYASGAFADAIKRLRKRSLYSLNPLAPTGMIDPAGHFPEALPRSTLMGYYGELLAGIAAEQFPPFGHKWEVPCYLFRFHDQAFFALERYRQSGDMPRAVFGRNGDDCLAFDRTGNEITRVLVSEAKCLSANQEKKIVDAHNNVSNQKEPLPVSLAQVCEVLLDQDTPDRDWIEKLIRLQVNNPTNLERFDCVVYVCRPPKQTTTWIPADLPHQAYSGGRKLAVVEVHIDQLPDHVKSVLAGIDKNGH